MAGTSGSSVFQWDGDHLTNVLNDDEINVKNLFDEAQLGSPNGPSNLPLHPTSPSHPILKGPPIIEVQPRREKRKIQHSEVKSTQPKTRVRSPNWSDGEKSALLTLKLETLVRSDITESWINIVSNHPDINERCTASCQGQWDTLKKQYDIIQQHESKILSGESNSISFWDMSEQDRRTFNENLPQNERLPRVFFKAWYVLMERIIEAETVKKAPAMKVARTTQVVVRNSRSSCMQNPPDLANVPTSQDRLKSKEKVSMSDDDLISRLAPYIKNQIDDAIKPLLSILQRQEDENQKHRESSLAREEAKLATERESMQLMQRIMLANSMGIANSFGVQDGDPMSVQPSSGWELENPFLANTAQDELKY